VDPLTTPPLHPLKKKLSKTSQMLSLKDNQNGTITLEYHQTGKTNGQVDLTDTPNMQATLTKVN
jgi:hypothetical protein